MAESDRQLVERVRRGDRQAFEELVRRHLSAAHATALGVVGEPADAEDVCQDAFISALEHLEDCRDPDRFGAWLMRIVRNAAYSARRRQQVRRAAPLDKV
ncbi:MAG: RNA polymerase sigma factor, partial [Gemmatimonadota bacterium]